jgi:arylsulfatase B
MVGWVVLQGCVGDVAPPARVPTELAVARVSPPVPRVTDAVTCEVQDLDGATVSTGPASDVVVEWTIDGEPADTATSTLTHGFRRGQRLACRARRTGAAASSAVRSAEVVVANAAPLVTALDLTPDRVFEADRPRCRARLSDPDGDDVTAVVEWAVDGVPAGAGEQLPMAASAGTHLTCQATPDDGSTTGTAARADVDVGPRPVGGNVLIVLADDVGVGSLRAFGVGAQVPPTPVLDRLASEGVRFDHATSHSVCSPTRAAIQTGREPWRTGVTAALSADGPGALPYVEVTLPEMLAEAPSGPYASSYVGKWHLATRQLDYEDHPVRSGWEWFSGSVGALGDDSAVDGQPQSYFDWVETENGESTRVTRYATIETTDDAISRMAVMPEPWILMVSYHAAHAPLHVPPPALWSGVALGETPSIQAYNAMIESLDHEMGRLLDAMSPSQRETTTILFLGDNGPWEDVVSAPLPVALGKGTPYELAVRVPLIVAGPWVGTPGSVSHELVSTTDVFATVAEVAGVRLTGERPLDSVSLLPLVRAPDGPAERTHVTTEYWFPPGVARQWYFGWRTIRDDRYKLVQWLYGREELYDLEGRDWEGADLLAAGPLDSDAQAALEELRAAEPFPLPDFTP